MTEPKPKFDPRWMAFLGCTLLGLGFCFFPEKLFVFIGCIIAGPGVGMLVAAYLPPPKTD
ncbi:MAG: hypothetical protein ACKVI3_08945 [Verrucomicrobiia bacterium]